MLWSEFIVLLICKADINILSVLFDYWLQRFEIVNGVVEVDGVTNETTVNQEEDKASEGTC